MRSLTNPAMVAGVVLVGIGGLRLAATAATAGTVRSRASGSAARSGSCPSWFVGVAHLLGLPWSPDRAWPWFVTGAVVAAGWLAFEAPEVLVVAGIGLGFARPVRRQVSTRRRDTSAELVAVLEVMVAELRTGRSLVGALARAGERPGRCGAEVAHIARQVAAGQGVQDALDGWAGTSGDVGAVLVVDALALAAGTGASQAEALHAVATTLRQRQARRREVRALASQARASGVVLVATPLAFAAVVAVVDPRVGRFLVGTPAGWACLVGGAALDAAGAWWMALLIRRVR